MRTSVARAIAVRRALSGAWPVAEGHVEPSLIAPLTGAPSERLLDLSLAAIEAARHVDLTWLSDRTPIRYPDVWPGEHYKLLSALVSLLAPKTVIELGTATGMSALAMKSALPDDGRLVTFDIVSWPDVPDAILRDEDFADGRLEQRRDDLSTPAGLAENADLLASAELIFLDTAHDGAQERAFLRGFDEVGLAPGAILVLDDIHLWRMISFWRDITRPKLDLTSFGHWSGTGIVDYG